VRAVVQRVSRASVTIAGEIAGAIDTGLVVFVGVAEGDGSADIDYTASKVLELRIFPDEQGRMNRSVTDVGGAVLAVSQFTLMGDVRRGRRPGFDAAAPPATARPLYDAFVARLQTSGLPIATGVFQADMDVALVNDGPVTILIDSRRTF
jgi:D-tyrosyl-tRNA(Tyr) deacylase